MNSGSESIKLTAMETKSQVLSASESESRAVRRVLLVAAGNRSQSYLKEQMRESADHSVSVCPVDSIFRFVRRLCRMIPNHDVVHLSISVSLSLWMHVLPAFLIARFFGRAIILDYRLNAAETHLEDIGHHGRVLLGQFDSIVVSTSYLSRLFAGYNLSTKVIPDLVETSHLKVRHITEVQPRILVTRPLEGMYNIPAALMAFKLVKYKYPRAEMTIIGEGSRRAYLEYLVKSERMVGVRFASRLTQEQITQEFSEADCYVNPAALDNLPISLLKALASGLPVVTTNAGEVRSIITDRVNGLMVPINNHVAIADSIIELVENRELVSTLSTNAPSAVTGFGCAKSDCKRWAELYRAVT